jgi:hypothetical protein
MLFLLGSIILKIFKSKPFFISKWQLFKHFTQNISETGSFIKFLFGRHYEIKKGFDLKFFMMLVDPNKNNI